MSMAAAQNIETARTEARFTSVDDFRSRTDVSERHIDVLRNIGCFDSLPESTQ